MGRRNPTYYNVRPRYTAGSPAQVDQATAERVAEEERGAYHFVLDGLEGEGRQRYANALGLRGIAESVREVRGAWEVTDLCTGEVYTRPFPDKMRKNGWRSLDELEKYERECVRETAPCIAESAEKVPSDAPRWWFKVNVNWAPQKIEVEVWEPNILNAEETGS